MSETIQTNPRSALRRWGVAGLIALVGVFIALSALGAWRVRYLVTNLDAISYMSIARQYANGHWAEAVNAFWSPMISWLIAPFISFGMEPTAAFMTVNAITVSTTLVLSAYFAWRVSGRRLLPTAIVIVVIGLFGLATLPMQTPDILVVTWTTGFIALIAWKLRHPHDRTIRKAVLLAVALGLAGTIAYLTKLYLLPVFAVGLVILTLIRRFQRRDLDEPMPRTWTHSIFFVPVVAVLVMLATSAPWIVALSVKYDTVTAGSSFVVNMESKFDPTQTAPGGDPYTLYAPPNRFAVSFGEDRTFEVSRFSPQGVTTGDTIDETSTPTASEPISLASRVQFYISQRIEAFPFYLNKVNSFAAMTPLLVAVFLGVVAFRRRSSINTPLALAIGLLWATYFGGYALITSPVSAGGNVRYYWPLFTIAILGMVAAYRPVTVAVTARLGGWRKLLAILLILAIPAASLWQHGLGKTAPFSTVSSNSGVRYLFEPTPGNNEMAVAETLSSVIAPGSRIVGSNSRTTTELAFYLEAQSYGRAGQEYDPTDPVFQQVMADAGIDFYLEFVPNGEEGADLESLGSRVMSVTDNMPCTDEKQVSVEACTITVIELDL